MKEPFKEQAFRPATLELIGKAGAVCEEYAAQGYRLTLRQVYYQMVARDIIPNNQRSYKRLGSVLNDARLAGLLDWQHIEDRGRNQVVPPHWSSPADIIDAAARSYRIDKWVGQDRRVWVVAEKDAVSSVLEPVCRRLDVVFLANRGYCSQSTMYELGKEFYHMTRRGVTPVVLYFGDHDPSGIDMTRDVRDRLSMFVRVEDVEVVRVALNMDQVERYTPPPNPAKQTDSRFQAYIDEYGEESWELDALEPSVLDALVEEHVSRFRDDALYRERQELEDEQRARLAAVAEHWSDDEDE